MAVSSNSIPLLVGNNLSRRSILGGLAIASVGGVAAKDVPQQNIPVASAQRAMTAHERYEHHLAELKKAAEEIDPRIALWDGFSNLGDEDEDDIVMMISAHLRKGRYEGDGDYETQHGEVYRVRLLDQLQEGRRMFAYIGHRGPEHVIREDRLEAFIVRKVF
ncbi:MAG: hypothetical protein E5X41_06040 [Mesorhizobium sp.]|nr:MAG: hypothetical protein E5X41_06040 [Mesorhizobium sp.]